MKNILKKIVTLFVPLDVETDDGTFVTPPKPILPYILIVFVIVFYDY